MLPMQHQFPPHIARPVAGPGLSMPMTYPMMMPGVAGGAPPVVMVMPSYAGGIPGMAGIPGMGPGVGTYMMPGAALPPGYPIFMSQPTISGAPLMMPPAAPGPPPASPGRLHSLLPDMLTQPLHGTVVTPGASPYSSVAQRSTTSTSSTPADLQAPCRHFMEGKCNRRKCRFVHSSSATPSASVTPQTSVADRVATGLGESQPLLNLGVPKPESKPPA